jgi:hypothetical protein
MSLERAKRKIKKGKMEIFFCFVFEFENAIQVPLVSIYHSNPRVG